MSNNDDDWLLEILLNLFQWGEEQEYESNIHVLLFIIQPKNSCVKYLTRDPL